jgi:nucleotide-binding universal stress UspA family protein
MFKNFLVAVDLEHDTHIDDLLRVASDMANAQGAKVHLLHVIRAAPAVVSQFLPKSYETMASERIEKDLTTLAAKVDLDEGAAAISVRFGDVYQEILAHAKKIDADLIIVASHKPNVGDYLLGTTAARVVRHATCSVFVVRLDRVTDR